MLFTTVPPGYFASIRTSGSDPSGAVEAMMVPVFTHPPKLHKRVGLSTGNDLGNQCSVEPVTDAPPKKWSCVGVERIESCDGILSIASAGKPDRGLGGRWIGRTERLATRRLPRAGNREDSPGVGVAGGGLAGIGLYH